MKYVTQVFIADCTGNVEHNNAWPQYTFWHAQKQVPIIDSMVDGLVLLGHSNSNSDFQTLKL
jgi:hypothetical protein